MAGNKGPYFLYRTVNNRLGCAGCRVYGEEGEWPYSPSGTYTAPVKPVSRSLTGVDSDADGIRLMEQEGFTVHCDDITSMDL